MNKRQILASLSNIANELDTMGLFSEASVLTNVMERVAIGPSNTGFSEMHNEFISYRNKAKNIYDKFLDKYNSDKTKLEFVKGDPTKTHAQLMIKEIREYLESLLGETATANQYSLENWNKLKKLQQEVSGYLNDMNRKLLSNPPKRKNLKSLEFTPTVGSPQDRADYNFSTFLSKAKDVASPSEDYEDLSIESPWSPGNWSGN